MVVVVLAALGALVRLADTRVGGAGGRARRAEARVAREVAAVGRRDRAVGAELREHVPVAVVQFVARRRRPVLSVVLRDLMLDDPVDACEKACEQCS